MLEILQIICSIAIIVMTPIETRKVLNGWVRPRFKGDPAAFRTAYRKQLVLFTWLGGVFALVLTAIALIDAMEPVRLGVKLFIAALWAGVGVIAFLSRRKLDAAPAAA